MHGRYTRAGSASLHLFKGRWGWLDVSIEGRAWLNVAYLQLEVRDRRARAGSVAPLHPLKGWRGSFAARLDVFLKVEHSVPMERLGRAGCRLFAESEVCGRRARAGSVAPLHPLKGGEVLLLCCWEFLLRVKRVSLLMTSWMLLVCKLEVCGRRVRAGSVAPLHPLKRQRDSFAARLNVSIEGRACWFAFDELDVACLQNRRCVTVARGRGASLPCIPSRGGEVLLLRGWAFLLRVECWLFAESEVSVIARGRGASLPCIPSRDGEVLLLRGWEFLLRVAHSVPMERLGRAGRCLFAGSEVRDRCSRAGSVAPLHPLKGWRGSFTVLLGVSIEGKAC